MRRSHLGIAAIACTLWFSVFVNRAAAQGNRCADCHLANPDAPGHLFAWDRSAHGQNGVGCDACHGGDASTFESFAAHQGILNSGNPSSPVNRANIPRTCGSCHSGPFVAFQSSKMYALLATGNPDVPVCTTCHSAVGGILLSPRALESRCEKCHAADKPGSHPEFPAQGRRNLESIQQIRELLKQAQPLLRRVRDAELRRQFEEQYRQAEVPVIEALNFQHAFSFEASEERQRVARQRAEALLDQLVNAARP
jgi:hypothetical protein